MCTTGMPFFTATSVQASVELTSPTTSTQDGLCSSSAGSNRFITSAVCTACEPEPTSRLMSGCGNARSAKSLSLMLAS